MEEGRGGVKILCKDEGFGGAAAIIEDGRIDAVK
jgi:hypothetical protein